MHILLNFSTKQQFINPNNRIYIQTNQKKNFLNQTYKLKRLQLIIMPDLDNKIKEISNKYTQLKKCQNTKQKQQLSNLMIKLCVDFQADLYDSQNQKYNKNRFKWQRQIREIKNKAIQIVQEIQRSKKNKKTFQMNSSKEITLNSFYVQNKSLGEIQLAKKVVRSIIFKQLSSQQIEVSADQFQKIAVKMQQNLLVMEQIKQLIHQQGNDLQIIEENIAKAYQQSSQANKQLDQAAQILKKARMFKIRLGLGGILSSIGYFFMGIPGAFIGLLGALKIGKLRIGKPSK